MFQFQVKECTFAIIFNINTTTHYEKNLKNSRHADGSAL